MGAAWVPVSMSVSVLICARACASVGPARPCGPFAPSLLEGLGCLWQDLLGSICEAKVGRLGTAEGGGGG